MRSLIAGVTVVVLMWAPGKILADQPAEGSTETIQDLKLTDQQEAQIASIRDECKPKVQDAAKGLAAVVKEEMEKVGAVLTPDQKAKVQALKEERPERRPECLAERIQHFEDLDLTDAEMDKIAEIRKEYKPKIAMALEGLKGILSPEQSKAREDALKAGKKRKEVIASLNLTDAQKEKVEAVCQDLSKLVREEMEKVNDLLTDGQKEKLQDFKEERKERVRDRKAHAVANLKELNLTDDQKAQIAQIRQEYRPKVQEAGNNLRAAVRDEGAKIVAVLKG
jgi:Spy/CpxP family protein refolding chaperone